METIFERWAREEEEKKDLLSPTPAPPEQEDPLGPETPIIPYDLPEGAQGVSSPLLSREEDPIEQQTEEPPPYQLPPGAVEGIGGRVMLPPPVEEAREKRQRQFGAEGFQYEEGEMGPPIGPEEQPKLPSAVQSALDHYHKWLANPEGTRPPREQELDLVATYEGVTVLDDPKMARRKKGIHHAQDVAFNILKKFPGELGEDMDPLTAGYQRWLLSQKQFNEDIKEGVYYDVVADLIDEGELSQDNWKEDLSEWRSTHSDEFDQLLQEKKDYYWQKVLATAQRGLFVESGVTTQDILEGKGTTIPLPEWAAQSAPIVLFRAAASPPRYREVVTRREMKPEGLWSSFLNVLGVSSSAAYALIREAEKSEKRGESSYETFWEQVKEEGIDPIETWGRISEAARSEGVVDFLRSGGWALDAYPYAVDAWAENITAATGMEESGARLLAQYMVAPATVGMLIKEPDWITSSLSLAGAATKQATKMAAVSKANKIADEVGSLAKEVSKDNLDAGDIFQRLDYSERDLVRGDAAAALRSRIPAGAKPYLPPVKQSKPPEEWVDTALREEKEIQQKVSAAKQKAEKAQAKTKAEREGLERAAADQPFDAVRDARKELLTEAQVNLENSKAVWDNIERPSLPKALRGESSGMPHPDIARGTFIKEKALVDGEIKTLQEILSKQDEALSTLLRAQTPVKPPKLKDAVNAQKQLEEGSDLKRSIKELEKRLVKAQKAAQKPPPGQAATAADNLEALRAELQSRKALEAQYTKTVENYREQSRKFYAHLRSQKGGDDLQALLLRRKKTEGQINALMSKLTKGTKETYGVGLNTLAASSRAFADTKDKARLVEGALKLYKKDIGPYDVPFIKGKGYSETSFTSMTDAQLNRHLQQLREKESAISETIKDLGITPEFLKSTRDILKEALERTATSYRQMALEIKGNLPQGAHVGLLSHASKLAEDGETATINRGSLLREIQEDEFLRRSLDSAPDGSLLREWADTPLTTGPTLIRDVNIASLQEEMANLHKRAASERSRSLNLERAKAGITIRTSDPTARIATGEYIAGYFKKVLKELDPGYASIGPYAKEMFNVQRVGQNTLSQLGKELTEIIDFVRFPSVLDRARGKTFTPGAARKTLFQYMDTQEPIEMAGGSFTFLNRTGSGSIFETSRTQLLGDLNLRADALDRVDKLLSKLRGKGADLDYSDLISTHGDQSGKVIGQRRLRSLLKSRFGVEIDKDEAQTLLSIAGSRKVADTDAVPIALQGLSRMWIGSEVIPGAQEQMALIKAARKILKDSDSFQSFSRDMRKATMDELGITQIESSEVRALAFGANALGISYANASGARAMRNALGGTLTLSEARSANALMTNQWMAEGVNFEDGIAALNKMGAPLTLTSWTESMTDMARQGRQLVSIATADGGTAWMPKIIRTRIEAEADRIIKEVDRRSMPASMGDQARNAAQAWKASLITGIGLPNPRYWVNNIVGDHSQIWMELGLIDASRLSFQNMPWNLPFMQRRFSEAQGWMDDKIATMPKGRVRMALGSATNALFNPLVNDLLRHGEGTLISKVGERIPKSQLRQELVEMNITDTFVQQELLSQWHRGLERSFEANRRSTYDQFTDKIEAVSQHIGKWNRDLSYHAASVQQRQRIALYCDLRMKGASKQDAAQKTLDALYDWKHGAAPWEMNTYFRYVPFARFWRNAVKQSIGAFTEPFTAPTGEMLRRSLKGETRLARAKQQAMLWSGFPQLINPQDPDDIDPQVEAAAIAALRFPSWTSGRPTIGTGVVAPWIKDFYALTQGRKITHGFRVMPPSTPFDAMELSMGIAWGISQFMTLPFKGDVGPGDAAPHWERAVWEPVLSTLFPFQKESLEALLQGAGMETGGARHSEFVKLRPQQEMLYRNIPGISGLIQTGEDNKARMPTLLALSLTVPLAGLAYAPVAGTVRRFKPFYSLGDPKAVYRALDFARIQAPNLYKNVWGDNPYRWSGHEDWIRAAGFAGSRSFGFLSPYYFHPSKDVERDQKKARAVTNSIRDELLGKAGGRGLIDRAPKVRTRYEWEEEPEF